MTTHPRWTTRAETAADIPAVHGVELAAFPVVRLRSQHEVDRWLADYSSSAIRTAARAAPSAPG